ncbi:MAG: cytochrome C oxidase subunit IV family protein [Chloroflexota bacterium]
MTLAEYRRKRGEPIITEEEGADDAHAEHHPGVTEYTQIGLILFIITAIEVGIYYVGLGHNLLVAALIGLSAIKFSLVVLWFMHLRFDNRLFSTLFLMGLATAASVFTVVLVALHGQLV